MILESRGMDGYGGEAVVESSERLTESRAWQPVPPNRLVVISRGQVPALIPRGEFSRRRVA